MARPEFSTEPTTDIKTPGTALRNLKLTRVGQDFDIKHDIALGPWCFIGSETEFPEWEDLDYVDPFITPSALAKADGDTRRLANQLALKWAATLNERHGRSYSAEYWRTLLILWLVSGVQTTWRRYRHMELMIARHGHTPMQVDVLDVKPDWNFAHIISFSRHIGEDRYFDFWMNSEILKIITPTSWTLVSVNAENDKDLTAADGRNAPPDNHGRISDMARRIFGRLCFDTVSGVRSSKILFSLYIKMLPKRPSRGKPIVRDDDVFSEFPKSYLDYLDGFLESTLPKIFSDGYSELEAAALQNKYVPGRLFVDHLLTLDARRRFVLAHAQEAGERLIGSQHGCGYGACLTVPWAAEGEYKYDGFISWGWKQQEDLEGRMIPLPSPLLSRTMNRHVPRSNQLIFTGARIFLPDARFGNRPQPTQWFNYRYMKRQFIDALSTDTREELVYRPYLKAPETMRDIGYLELFFAKLPILRGPMDGKMLECKLLVLDYPGTSMNIGMAANVPMVSYWDPQAWPECRQAKPLNDALRKAGILHDDPESAARHINHIWDDVPGWWNSKDVQQARNDWCRQYARASRVWWWHWIVALWRLAGDQKINDNDNEDA